MSAILLQNVRGTGWCETNILKNLKTKCGGAWHIISSLSEKVGGTRPPLNCAHACTDGGSSGCRNVYDMSLATFAVAAIFIILP